MAQSPGRLLFGFIPWYSLLILTGIAVAILLSSREEKRLGLPEDTVVDICLRMIPAGIVGARIYYCAFAWDAFRDNPITVLYIWEGGIAIYGALIAGGLAVLLYARRKRLPVLTVLDCVIIAVPLAQGIGRWGNYFNMEAYGLPITDPGWQFFPAGVLIGGEWHMATFFYESLWDVLVFAWLWRNRKRMERPGDTFLCCTALYACGRQLVEGLRMDSLYSGSLRVSQLLAMAAALAVLGILAYRAGSWHAPLWLRAVLALLAAGIVLRVLLPGENLAGHTILSIAYGGMAAAALIACTRKGREACPKPD